MNEPAVLRDMAAIKRQGAARCWATGHDRQAQELTSDADALDTEARRLELAQQAPNPEPPTALNAAA